MYDLIFVDLSQFVADPIRTGVQRVLVKILQHLPRAQVMPFRIIDEQHVAILDPALLDVCARFFNGDTPSARALAARASGVAAAFSEEENLIRLIGHAPVAVLLAERFFARAARIINLEAFSDPRRSRFYLRCPPGQRGKVSHFIHDFLLFEQPEVFPQLNWRYASDNIELFTAWCAAGSFFVSTPQMQKKVARYFNRPLSDVTVVHFGGDLSEAPGRPAGAPAAKRRVLVVGTIEPRKYPLEVASALDELAVRHPELDCVMAGNMGWTTTETHAALEAIFNSKRVRHLTGLGDVALAGLVGETDVALYVSSVEGFGLPVIEYAARGIPQVTNRAVPASEVIDDPRALVLDTVSVATLIEAVERQLAAPGDRTPYYTWRWADCAAEIAAVPPKVASATRAEPASCWSAAIRLVRELRGRNLEWEALKRAVWVRLFPEDRVGGLLGGEALVTPELRAEIVEQVAEIVSDNLRRVFWADMLVVQPLLQELIRCIFLASPLEGASHAFMTYLGRPIDPQAAAEVVGMVETAQKRQRVIELIHSGEASQFLPEPTAVALRTLLGEVMKVLECATDKRPDLWLMCQALGIAAPTLADVVQAEDMREAGMPDLAILLLFSHRRPARGDAIDLLLEAAAKLARERRLLAPPDSRLSPAQKPLPRREKVLATEAPPFELAAPEMPAELAAVSRYIPLHSVLLTRGWYDVEIGETAYRWMGKAAAIVNPEPARRLRHLRVTIGAVYGADEPFLTASIDAQKADIVLEPVPEGRGWFLFVLTHETTAHGELISIEATVTDSPARAEQSSDERELSFCVTRVVFVYQNDPDGGVHP